MAPFAGPQRKDTRVVRSKGNIQTTDLIGVSEGK